MSDHDFEKQVQLRLEQLKLRPSNAVWAEVERNIRLQKRRRRLLIWLPAALLVMIAGGYLALQQSPRHDVATSQAKPAVETTSPVNTPVSPNQIPSTDNSTSIQHNTPAPVNHTGTTAQADPVTATPITPAAPNGKTSAPAADTRHVHVPLLAPKANGPAALDQQPESRLATTRPARNNKTGNTTKNNTRRKQSAGNNDLAGRKPTAAASLPGLNVPAPVTKPTDNKTVTTDQPDSTMTAVTAATTDADLATAIVDSTGADSTQTLAATPAAKTPAVAAATPAKRKQESGKESKWQFGVNAEGGASGVSADGLFGFLDKEAKSVPDLAAAPNYNSQVGNNAFAPQFPRPPVNRASSLSTGFAFSIGGFAQRKISNRISLSAGLQYTQLSARQVVGNKVNNNRTVNQAPSNSRLVASYYDNSGSTFNEYSNKYHFIELPVTLHAQLNEGKRLPLGIDVGFSASRLISTTALHYDGIGNVYYKDDALFNKTQWTASAGFYLKLFNQSSHPLSVGPVMRYNMSPLLVKDFSTGQHLWSVGLRARVLLKK